MCVDAHIRSDKEIDRESVCVCVCLTLCAVQCWKKKSFMHVPKMMVNNMMQQ